MVRDHDVLVSNAGIDGEANCVISIQFTDGHDLEKELVGSDLGNRLPGKLGGGGFGLVDLTPWRFWTSFPMMVALAEGQYLVAFSKVIPGHDE